MARKRLRPTAESLIEAVGRLGLSPAQIDVEALRIHLELPEFGAAVEDERVALALREMKTARAFVETGIPALKRAVPALRAVVAKDQSIRWTIRVGIPRHSSVNSRMRVAHRQQSQR